MGWATREYAAGQGIACVVGDSYSIFEIGCANHGQDRAKNLFLGDAGAWFNVGENGGRHEEALATSVGQ